MLREAENIVKIEGILSETDLKYGSYMKNGKNMDTISGSIKIKVAQQINGENTVLEIPVHMFSNKYKADGVSPNPAFESIERVMKEFVSIAAAGSEDGADRVRITSGKIQMNEYYGRGDALVSFPRITASFVTKVKKEECKPQATFATEFYVGSMDNELDREGMETGRYLIKGIVPQYGGRVDVVNFVAVAPGVISAVSSYWNVGDTVKASGRLNFSSTTETIMKEVDFGEPIEQTRTINVSELVITGGSQTPMEGDFAYDNDDIKTALAERKERLSAQKEKDTNKAKNKTQAAPARPTAQDLGF